MAQTAKERRDRLADPEDATDVLGPAVPTSPPDPAATTGELATVAVNGDGRTPTDRALGHLVDNATYARVLEFDAGTHTEILAVWDELHRLLDRALEQGNARVHVDDAIIRALPDLARQFARHADSWVIQRGLNGDES